MHQKRLEALNRRKFIRNSIIAGIGIAAITPLITGCGSDDPEDSFDPQGDYGFFEGVASFDPSQSGIILWSRYSRAINEETNPLIILDVATDIGFSDLVVSQEVLVDTFNDNTITVDVSNLQANTSYYYRFRNEMTNSTSVVGETKTLPIDNELSQIRLAIVSCANYQSGLFNVYGAVADSDIDIVVHLGDYIYEYGIGGYGTNDATASLNRQHDPAGEILTLDDYRARYRQYRSDPQLQLAHQKKPFICVWDDHEIANDAYKDGAQNHQQNEGSFENRKIMALQAWHEYLPARVNDNTKIYRDFKIGNIVHLMMLDTRIIGRDQQLNYFNYIDNEQIDANAFLADWLNPQRTILGSEQKDWLIQKISSSTSSWQMLGSQVLMGKYWVPAELLTIISRIASSGATQELVSQFSSSVTELIILKARLFQNDPTLTDEERARVETTLPYNLDAWDGYPIERDTILAAASGKKLIAIAGDTHNAWHAHLTDPSGNKMGDEFATSSVTSPGFDAIFASSPNLLSGLQQSLTSLVDDLKYMNAMDRGYVHLTISNMEAKSEWRFINSIAVESRNTATDHEVITS
jgi:alkaline phosphatase D